jgi:hypothetical protein
MIEGALKADGRIAAKNAVKIRAALRQVTDFKRVFDKYQETQPQPTDNPAQDRTRARSWILLNIYLNDEPLRQTVMRAWAEAYVLGQAAAGEWIAKTEAANKAADDGYIDWANWRPGDRATALLLRPTGGFAKYLQTIDADSYFKKFNKETIENLGTALSDSIAAGLDAESAAVMIGRHVASPSRALTIAITEQNRAMSFGSIQRYKEAELEKMEWHVSDPCDKCAKNAGVEVEIGQSFPTGNTQPPAHPHCRCVLLPVIPGMEEPDPMGIDGGLAPMPEGAAIVQAEFPKNLPQTKNLKSWDKNKIMEIAKIKENFAEPVKIWNGDAKEYQTLYRQVGDPRLKALLEAQGFTAKPMLVGETEFEALAQKGGIKVYRGLVGNETTTAAQMVEQFKTGDMFVGTGVIGNGVYAGTDLGYVIKYAEDNPKNVIKMLLSPKAKYIDSKDAQEGARKLSGAFYDAAFKRPYKDPEMGKIVDSYIKAKGPIPGSGEAATKYRDELREIGWLYHEPGAYAASMGYDAIKHFDEDGGVFVILNRGAVVVKK